jgi:hypothetical protein
MLFFIGGNMGYRLAFNEKDPEIVIKMSPMMLKDLVSRCEENGTNPNVEMLIRLARSLENDKDRDSSDALLAAIFTDNAKEETIKTQ